jgi:hypothetical protein
MNWFKKILVYLGLAADAAVVIAPMAGANAKTQADIAKAQAGIAAAKALSEAAEAKQAEETKK